jgi:hypothetical protein
MQSNDDQPRTAVSTSLDPRATAGSGRAAPARVRPHLPPTLRPIAEIQLRPRRRDTPITCRLNLTQFVRSIPLPLGATKRVREGRAEQRALVLVEPSRWTAGHRWSVMGTAFDLAIGDRLDRSALRNVCSRASDACASRDPRFRTLARRLRKLLCIGPARVRPDGTRRRHRDYYRALLLLAEMDSVHRAGSAPVPDAIFRDGPIDSLRTLRQRLRAVFSVDAICELHALVTNAAQDVPTMGRGYFHYNPTFGCAIGPTMIPADGDLQIDDLLVEFKVSIHDAITAEHVRQLLGYAALDHLAGSKQIYRIGIYNPRRRERWVCSVDEAARRMGWGSFDEFLRLFEASASDPSTTIGSLTQ